MLFAGVNYHLSSSLLPERRNELKSVLDANGANLSSLEEATHIVTDTTSYEGHEQAPEGIQVVTDFWVDRSIVMGKMQETEYYSADPDKVFSGVVACCTDIEACDREVIAAGINALGGLFREGYTRDCTHVLAVRPGSEKYETAMAYQRQTHPEEPYEWPNPPILRSDYVLTKARLPPARKALVRSAVMDEEPTDKLHALARAQTDVWNGKSILLSQTLGLEKKRLNTVQSWIQRSGGRAVESSGDELQDIEQCDIYITQHRIGKTFLKAYRAQKTIATLAWLFHVQKTGHISRPESHLIHYPTLPAPIKGFENQVITATNYEGDARRYLKKLIEIMGGQFTPQMTNKNTAVVAAFIGGEKTTRARDWNIPVVNHTWLEDCFADWVLRTPAQDRYISFPKGVNFGAQVGSRAVLPLLEEDLQEIERFEVSDQQLHSQKTQGSSTAAVSQTAARQVLQEETNVDVSLQGKRGRAAKENEPNPKPPVGNPSPRKASPPAPRESRKEAPAHKPDVESAVPGPSTPKEKKRVLVRKASKITRPELAPDRDVENEPTRTLKTAMRSLLNSVDSDAKARKASTHAPSTAKLPDAFFDSDLASSSDEDEPKVKAVPSTSSPNSRNIASGRPLDVRGKDSHSPIKKRKSRIIDDGDDDDDDDDAFEVSRKPETASPSKSKFKEVVVEIISPSKASQDKKRHSKAAHFDSDDDTQPSTSRAKTKVSGDGSPDGRLSDIPAAFLQRTPSRRQAASKASQKLHENALDMNKYEKQKRSNNFKGDWEGSEAGKVGASSQETKKRRQSVVEETPNDDGDNEPRTKKVKTENGQSGKKSKSKRVSPAEEVDRDGADSRDKCSQHAVNPSKICILSTQVVLDDQVVKGLRQLGVRTANKPTECTLLIANSIGRTEKFLCSMATARCVVTDKWAAETVNANRILDPKEFALRDAEGEKKFGFNLTEAVKRSQTRGKKLFEGHTFYFTSKLGKTDKVSTYKSIISSAGGKVIIQNPTIRMLKGHKDRHVLGIEGDGNVTDSLIDAGFQVYIPEFILMGVLTQQIDWEDTPHRLRID